MALWVAHSFPIQPSICLWRTKTQTLHYSWNTSACLLLLSFSWSFSSPPPFPLLHYPWFFSLFSLSNPISLFSASPPCVLLVRGFSFLLPRNYWCLGSSSEWFLCALHCIIFFSPLPCCLHNKSNYDAGISMRQATHPCGLTSSSQTYLCISHYQISYSQPYFWGIFSLKDFI